MLMAPCAEIRIMSREKSPHAPMSLPWKATADDNAEKVKAEKALDELRGALDILEEQLGTGMRQYDSDDGTWPSHVKKVTATQCHVLRSVPTTKTTWP